MKKLTIIFATIAICFGITTNSFAQKGKASADTPVTSTIQNSDANFTAYNIQSDIFDSTSGSYYKGVDSVESIIQGIGDWELDLINTNSTRRGYVDFPAKEEAISNPNNLTPPGDGLYSVRFLAQCSARGYKLQTLAPEATISCPLIVAARDSNGDQYSIRFNQQNYTGTNDVPWTCTSAPGSSCTRWRAQSRNSGKLIAQLLKIRRVGNKTYTDDYGQYYFSFDISLAK